jgi:hypothetical protein
VNGNQVGTFGFPKKTVRHPAREVLQGGSGWRSPTPILELSIMLATTRHVDLIRAIAGVSAIGDM